MSDIQSILDKFSEQTIYDSLYPQLGYAEPMPTIDEFIESEEYLGKVTNGGTGIYDYWRDVLRQIYPTPYTSDYHTIMLRGAIGIGKSVVGKVGSLYNICKMLKLKDPRQKFGLLPTVSIEYFVYGADLNLIDAVVMSELSEWINESPFFKTKLNAHGKSWFKGNFNITSGSRIRANVGRAIFSALFEEIQQELIHNQLQDNYNSILARIKSRFISEEGTFGQVFLVGSAGGAESFAEVLTEKSREDPGILIIDPPQWDVLSHKRIATYEEVDDLSGETKMVTQPVGGKLSYKPERFKVFIGDETKEPLVVMSQAEIETQKLDPDKILEVPYEYFDNFQNDIYIAIRDLAGISTRAQFRFFTNLSKIGNAFIGMNWFDRDIIRVSFYNNEDTILSLANLDNIRFRRNPKAPRFIHLDIGYASDITGISAVHISHFTKVERVNNLTGVKTVVHQPVFIQDFAVGISRYPGEETPIFKLRDFIKDLVNAGVPVGGVSTDGFQSVSFRQELLKDGISTELISVDRHKEHYTTFKLAVYEGRFFGVKNLALYNELKGLRVVNGKVDHAEGGNTENPTKGYGKDISDATCGAMIHANSRQHEYQTFNLFKDVSEYDLMNSFQGSDFDKEINHEMQMLGITN